jgi:hypothetical protein
LDRKIDPGFRFIIFLFSLRFDYGRPVCSGMETQARPHVILRCCKMLLLALSSLSDVHVAAKVFNRPQRVTPTPCRKENAETGRYKEEEGQDENSVDGYSESNAYNASDTLTFSGLDSERSGAVFSSMKLGVATKNHSSSLSDESTSAGLFLHGTVAITVGSYQGNWLWTLHE